MGSLTILVIAGSRGVYAYGGRKWAQNVVVAILTVIIFSLLFDVLYIACTRWLLRVAAQCNHFAAIFLLSAPMSSLLSPLYFFRSRWEQGSPGSSP